MDLRKFHYNILCRSELREQGAEILAGGLKSIGTKTLYDMKLMKW